MNAHNPDAFARANARHDSFQTDVTLDETGAMIEGTGHFDADHEGFYDADIGGSDGLEVTYCKLLWIDGPHGPISRDMLEHIFGVKMVEGADKAGHVAYALSLGLEVWV